MASKSTLGVHFTLWKNHRKEERESLATTGPAFNISSCLTRLYSAAFFHHLYLKPSPMVCMPSIIPVLVGLPALFIPRLITSNKVQDRWRLWCSLISHTENFITIWNIIEILYHKYIQSSTWATRRSLFKCISMHLWRPSKTSGISPNYYFHLLHTISWICHRWNQLF